MSSNIEFIKKLREEFSASMSACQKALVGVDLSSPDAYKIASDNLRKLGINAGSKKASADAKEGFISYRVYNDVVAILKVSCQTDFVAKNASLHELVAAIFDVIKNNSSKSFNEILSLSMGSSSIAEKILEVSGKLGEKIEINAEIIKKEAGQMIGCYVHNSTNAAYPSENCGNIISYITCQTQETSEKLQNALNDISMHVTAMNSKFLSEASIAQEILDSEMAIYKEQSLKIDKPENVKEMINKNKLQTFIKENCLLTQTFIKDPKFTVSEYLNSISKNATLVSFKRISIA
jgi:elongation factor Ts